MTFAYTVVGQGVEGDHSYIIYSYTGATGTNDTITTVKGVVFCSWTPATVRASATINWWTTAGSIVINGVTASDTGYVKVHCKGGF